MEILNLTPHTVVLSNGTKYEPTGVVARVISKEYKRKLFNMVSHCGVEGLPSEKKGTYYIVSAVVAHYCQDRNDLVCPNTSRANRDSRGIRSVPNLIQYYKNK